MSNKYCNGLPLANRAVRMKGELPILPKGSRKVSAEEVAFEQGVGKQAKVFQ